MRMSDGRRSSAAIICTVASIAPAQWSAALVGRSGRHREALPTLPKCCSCSGATAALISRLHCGADTQRTHELPNPMWQPAWIQQLTCM